MKSFVTTRKLVLIGMMFAITIVLCYTPLGIIPTPIISATIMHIPTIIIAILEGPIVGAIVGFLFGATTMFRAVTSPQGILDPFFINPLISVLPRVLIGITSYYVYAALCKVNKKQIVNVIIAAAVGSLTNTIGAMGMLYAIYAKRLATAIADSGFDTFIVDTVSKIGLGFLVSGGSPVQNTLKGIIFVFGFAEMIAAAIISTVVVMALKTVIRKYR